MSDPREGCSSSSASWWASGWSKITRTLMELEAGPDPEAGQGALRELHGLKGEARMMGFADINTLVHEMEELVRSTEPPGTCWRPHPPTPCSSHPMRRSGRRGSPPRGGCQRVRSRRFRATRIDALADRCKNFRRAIDDRLDQTVEHRLRLVPAAAGLHDARHEHGEGARLAVAHRDRAPFRSG